LLDHLIDRAAEAVEILPLRAQRLEAWVKRQPQPVGQWVRAAAFTAKPGTVCLPFPGSGDPTPAFCMIGSCSAGTCVGISGPGGQCNGSPCAVGSSCDEATLTCAACP